jgi:hypothetical protein
MYFKLKKSLATCKQSGNWFMRAVASKIVVLPVLLISSHLSNVSAL